jgi:hypothetical protein
MQNKLANIIFNKSMMGFGRAVVQAGFPPRLPGFEPGSGHVGFVVDKTALGKIFLEYFGFFYQAFHRLFHTHHHSSSSGAGTIAHLVASMIVHSVPLHQGKRKMGYCHLDNILYALAWPSRIRLSVYHL